MNKFFIKISLVFAMLSFVACAERGIDIVNLRCDYMESPLGVDNPNPVLQWQLISEGTGKSQSAYRIIVSDDLSLIEDKEIIGTLEKCCLQNLSSGIKARSYLPECNFIGK